MMHTEEDLGIARLGGVGILTAHDLTDLSAGVVRVYNLMKDGRWHRAEEIRLAAGKGGEEASEGLRRLRELRQWFEIDRERDDGRLFRYRLIPLSHPPSPSSSPTSERPSKKELREAAEALREMWKAKLAGKVEFPPALVTVGRWISKGAPP